jgi:hypothetical protein
MLLNDREKKLGFYTMLDAVKEGPAEGNEKKKKKKKKF